MRSIKAPALCVVSALSLVLLSGCNGGNSANSGVPSDIQAVFNKPAYKGATWALRVVNADTGKVLINYNAGKMLYIGSVRKTFTVGELMNQVGPKHHYDTPVYRQGSVDSSGILHGDLIIQASGDLTMGGRTNPDGSVAYTEYDHNEADSLGNAILTKPDPLAGYKALAAQVAASGIKEVTGDVAIDNRLFQPFNFRGEFDVVPIFVNDDMVDVTINPATVGQPASVVWRPHSAAFTVNDNLTTGAAGSTSTLQLDPEIPQCLGSPGCSASISGSLPVDYVPPLTNTFPLIQAFRIANPANYARTVFIEALEADGVKVDAPTVAVNPTQILPAKDSYVSADQVAKLTGLDFAKDATLILKVSYNIGADTSLVLYGLTQGVDSMPASLQVEQTNLAQNYGIPSDEYEFYDGSGGGETKAELRAVTKLLTDMHTSPYFSTYQDALPILAVNGSLEFVTDFESDPTLAGAAGQVYAKPGTWIKATATGGLDIKGQALGGYVHTKSGKTLAYIVDINDAQTASLDGLLQIFQDEGKISAMLWRDY
jgi:D-alanyl-D-alanine carboxypeptidase